EDNEALRALYLSRQSFRQFLPEPIGFEQFSGLLSCLRPLQLEGTPMAKYRYPSAGSLYPVQTYLYVKSSRIERLSAGVYYYHSADHRLVLLSVDANIDRRIHGPINHVVFDSSVFSIFFIG